MKIQTTGKSFVKGCSQVFVMLCLLALPAIGFSQPPGPGGGGGGGNPDDAVPFDSNMSLIFLAIGIAFAFYVVFKQLNKKKAAII